MSKHRLYLNAKIENKPKEELEKILLDVVRLMASSGSLDLSSGIHDFEVENATTTFLNV